ncbi:MAG: glycosyltransferase, partial [Thermohalobaculum sp.]|nr:glycosyltransferase [Thermohalobaculum sp.]
LIEAVALLRGGGIDARLEICGEDDRGGTGFRRSLEALIAEMGLAEHVELAGAVPEVEVRRRLERAHVFALASHAEPLGVAIMEAMALGCPVVATAAGGVPELVANGTEGLLVPPGNPAALARAIKTILRDPGKAQQMADAARRKVERGFHSGVSAEVLTRNIGKNLSVNEISVPAPE